MLRAPYVAPLNVLQVLAMAAIREAEGGGGLQSASSLQGSQGKLTQNGASSSDLFVRCSFIGCHGCGCDMVACTRIDVAACAAHRSCAAQRCAARLLLTLAS